MQQQQDLIHCGVGQREQPLAWGTLLDNIRCISCVDFHFGDLCCDKSDAALVDPFKLLNSNKRYPAGMESVLIASDVHGGERSAFRGCC